MKTLKIWAIAGLACMFMVACSDQSSTTSQQGPTVSGKIEQPDAESSSNVAATKPSPAIDDPTEIDGTLTQTEKGLALVTKEDTFLIVGQDLSDLVGQKVKITGAVADVEDDQVVEVMSVIPIE